MTPESRVGTWPLRTKDPVLGVIENVCSIAGALPARINAPTGGVIHKSFRGAMPANVREPTPGVISVL